MYMIITDLRLFRSLRFLKPGYARQLKHDKTILSSTTAVDISVLGA